MKKTFALPIVLLLILPAFSVLLPKIQAQEFSFGKTDQGGNQWSLWNWFAKVACRFQAPEDGEITKITFYGQAVGTGLQFRAVVYGDNAGAPNALLVYGVQIVLSQTQGWQSAPISLNVTGGTYYWIGIQYTGNGRCDFWYDSGAPSQTAWNIDAFEPNDPFGTPAYENYELSVYASYIPSVRPPRKIYVDASNVGDPLEDGSLVHPFDKIQEGINASNPGDNITVYAGTYNENVTVTSLQNVTLQGEDQQTTVINGSLSLVTTVSDFKVDNFTITGDLSMGMWVSHSMVSNCVLNDTIISATASNNTIANNSLNSVTLKGTVGAGYQGAYHTIIENNTISGGIGIESGSLNNEIRNNRILNLGIEEDPPDFTILPIPSGNNSISQNVFVTNSISLSVACYVPSNFTVRWPDTVVGNTFVNNSKAVVLIGQDGAYEHVGNTFHHNNFINNTVQVETSSLIVNNWTDSVEGNYWSNYTGVDSDHDGIGDTPYAIDANNTDYQPLMYPTFFPFPPSPPTYSDVGTNTTVAGQPCLFHAKWSDDQQAHRWNKDGLALSGFIFSTNNTGNWLNSTWTPLTGSVAWSNVTEVLNSTVGVTVSYQLYCNDTYSSWNSTSIYSFPVTPPPAYNSTISMFVSASPALVGYEVNIVGSLIYQHNRSGIPNVPVQLYSSITGTEYSIIASTTTNSDGSFSVTWFALTTGDYIIRAVYAGDSHAAEAETTVNLIIRDIEERALHTDGKYIKDEAGNIVFLRGVWRGDYSDTTTGWWTPEGAWPGGIGDDSYMHWDESYVRAEMQRMRAHGFNFFGTFIWGDWWLQDASTSLTGLPTDISYRTALKETLRIAQDYGIYVQLRLYSPAQTEGRKEFPYDTGEANCSKVWTAQNFIDFWVSVATELRDYPNVLLGIFDEPMTLYQTTPDPISGKSWFDVAEETINAMRAVGFDGLIVPHWAYAGDCYWMEQWINEERPTYNIAFSSHIYRFHGTYDGIGNSTDLDTIRGFIMANHDGVSYPPTGLHYNRIVNELNMPILVALGAYNGSVDNDEYTAFVNTLKVLNELELGYYGFVWHRSDMAWALQEHTVAIQPPNRVGQALIDSIDGAYVSSISIFVSSSPALVGYEVNIVGSLIYQHNSSGVPNVPVQLYRSITGTEYSIIASATTNSDGNFSVTWFALATGDYIIKAVYAGDSHVAGTETTVNLIIRDIEERVFSISSNSTVSDLTFNSTAREITFTVSGPTATVGYVNVFLSKDLVPDITNLKIYFDGVEKEYEAVSLDSVWFIHLSYYHSTHTVRIALPAAFPTHALQPLTILITSTVIAFVTMLTITLTLRKKKLRKYLPPLPFFHWIYICHAASYRNCSFSRFKTLSRDI